MDFPLRLLPAGLLAVVAAALVAGCGGATLDPVAKAASKTADAGSFRFAFELGMGVGGKDALAVTGDGAYDAAQQRLRAGAGIQGKRIEAIVDLSSSPAAYVKPPAGDTTLPAGKTLGAARPRRRGQGGRRRPRLALAGPARPAAGRRAAEAGGHVDHGRRGDDRRRRDDALPRHDRRREGARVAAEGRPRAGAAGAGSDRRRRRPARRLGRPRRPAPARLGRGRRRRRALLAAPAPRPERLRQRRARRAAAGGRGRGRIRARPVRDAGRVAGVRAGRRGRPPARSLRRGHPPRGGFAPR